MKNIDENDIIKRFRAISEFEIPPEVVADDLERTREAITNRINQTNECSWGMGRLITTSKIAKYAAAALIVMGILVAVHYLGGSPEGAQYAWGQVADNVNQSHTIVYKQKTSLNWEDDENPQENTTLCYYSKHYGVRMDNISGSLGKVVNYYLSADNTQVTLYPDKKLYQRTKLPFYEYDQRIKVGDPREIFRWILESDYDEIGRSEINGIAVTGIEFTHTTSASAQEKGFLWVDMKEKLPVYLEIEGFSIREGLPSKIIMTDFQWNVELEEDIFSVEIPSDYREKR